VAFVLLVATMPPMRIFQNSREWTGYTVQVDTAQWGHTLHQYVQTLASGTFGKDRSGNPVSAMVFPRLWNTLKLIFLSLALAIPLGMAKGIWDFNSLRKGGAAIGPMLTGLVQGLPDFLLVMLLQVAAVRLFYYFHIRPFPPAWDDHNPAGSMVLPVFCLTLIPLAYAARITSQAMVSVYDQEYIRTARAKGLHEAVVIFKHALAGALVQILDGLPNTLAVMFSNALIVELLDHYPGVTILLRDAVSPLSLLADARMQPPPPDVPVIVTTGVSLGLVFALLYAVLSILRRLVDPRLRERDVR
jgi:ABC-type dipeptide/oligopeptide/nickel transport system permease component